MDHCAHENSAPDSHAGGAPALSGWAASRARRFVWTLVAAWFVGLACPVAFCVYVNPWGNYGRAGILDVREYNDRLVKVRHLDGLPPEQLPEALVLGSSGLMSLRARDLEAGLGLRTFNAYVSGGQADDVLCFLKHLVHDLNHRPKLVIIGLETWTFAPPDDPRAVIPGVRRALLNTPALAANHPDAWWIKRCWSKVVDCYSTAQLTTAWEMLRHKGLERAAWPALSDGPILQPDGALVFAPGHKLRLAGGVHRLDERGRFPVSDVLQRVIRDGARHTLIRLPFYDFDGLWPQRVALLDEALALCRREGIAVVFVRTPLHPVALEALAGSPHARNEAALSDLIARWTRECPAVLGVVNATQVGLFGGDAGGFLDEMHCGADNTRLIGGRIVRLVQTRGLGTAVGGVAFAPGGAERGTVQR